MYLLFIKLKKNLVEEAVGGGESYDGGAKASQVKGGWDQVHVA